MKTAFAFLLAVVALAGCGKPPLATFEAIRVSDDKAGELASSTWGKVMYVPKQYAGFAYDSTGVYGNLHGLYAPEAVMVSFVAQEKKGLFVHRNICIPHDELMGHPVGPASDLIEWRGQPMIAAQFGSYGRTFWVSWKALGLKGPPPDGEVHISVYAMTRSGDGVRFRVGVPQIYH